MSLLSPRRVLTLLVVVCACSSDGGGGPPGPTVSSLTVNGGNNQIGPAGAALGTSLSVIARDASSNPVAGATVTWSAATGGGSVTPASSLTDASGIATTSRTLGPNAGTQTTTASAGAATPANFSAVAQIQGATQMAVNGGDNQSDTVLSTLVTQLSVLVRDQNNAAVAGVIVNWSATGGGSVSAPTSTTNASGIATITRTFGATSGAQGAQATVTGLAGSPVSFSLTATAGNATTLVKTSGDGGTAAPSGTAIYTVTVRDSHGNGKSGVSIDWATASGSIAPPSNSTGATGTASATHTLPAGTGDRTATATAASLPGGPSVTFTTTAAVIVTVSPSQNLTFSPVNVTISQNGTVSWQWAPGNALPHNITFAAVAGAPANVLDMISGSASRTFGTVGTFSYTCTNHINMNGQVTVNP